MSGGLDRVRAFVARATTPQSVVIDPAEVDAEVARLLSLPDDQFDAEMDAVFGPGLWREWTR